MNNKILIKAYPTNTATTLLEHDKIKEFNSLLDAQLYAYELGNNYNVTYWDCTIPPFMEGSFRRPMNMYEQLIQMIKEYDSDTFFARGRKLTDQEAQQLADRCIQHFIDNRLDGVILDCGLDEIRGEY